MIPWFDVPALEAGPVAIDLPTFLAVAGAIAAMAVARVRARHARLSVRRTIDGFAVILLCGLFFGHTLDVLLYRFAEFRAHWQLILPWHGGYCSLGALVGVSLAVAIFFRARDGGLRWDYLDQLAPAFLLGLGILRVGCFVGHHHAGRLSSFALAVGYTGGPRHDLGLYEALLVLMLLLALYLLEIRVSFGPGFVAVGLVCAYCIGRFGIELLRGGDLELLGRHSDPRYFGLTLVQYGSLLAVAASLIWMRRRRRDGLAALARGGSFE